MYDFGKYNEQIKELLSDNIKADNIIQEVKITIGAESIPAVSQLRYSGFHLTMWLDSEKDENLQEAKAHSKRAIFEAARHGIIFCYEAIKRFREIYGGEILPDVIDNYSVKMKNTSNAYRNILIKGDKEARADACIEAFRELRDILDELIACQPDLNSKREAVEKERFEKKRNFVFAVIGAIGAIFSIGAIIFQIF
jgi:hypothetical protein